MIQRMGILARRGKNVHFLHIRLKRMRHLCTRNHCEMQFKNINITK